MQSCLAWACCWGGRLILARGSALAFSGSDPNYEKLISNVQEILARGGSVVAITEEVA